MEKITEVIGEITQITNTIAAAVTEQSAVTGDISNATSVAAEKVNNITVEITDVASHSQSVTRSTQDNVRHTESVWWGGNIMPYGWQNLVEAIRKGEVWQGKVGG